MPEDKGEIDKNSPSELQSSGTLPEETTVLSRVEERLAKATSPQEVVLWTRVRAEIIRQNGDIVRQDGESVRRNEIVKEGEHRRFLEKVQVARRIGLSVGALTIGTVLITTGFTYPGILVLGAGLYELAPDLLKSALGKGKGRQNEDE